MKTWKKTTSRVINCAQFACYSVLFVFPPFLPDKKDSNEFVFLCPWETCKNGSEKFKTVTVKYDATAKEKWIRASISFYAIRRKVFAEFHHRVNENEKEKENENEDDGEVPPFSPLKKRLECCKKPRIRTERNRKRARDVKA